MRFMKFVLSVMMVVVMTLLRMDSHATAAQESDPLGQTFQTMLERLVSEDDSIHSAVMLVEGPDFKWKGAAGLADLEAGVVMTTEHQYRSASVGKMMTATLAVKLAE